MKRAHSMPFGAEVRADGTVRFRLWAPAAQRVDVMLEEEVGTKEARALPMQREDAGWHTLVTDAARAGTRYRYRIDGGPSVPDPASRANPDDVHGASVVVDPTAFDWAEDGWRGRPWHEAVIYELHVGTFTPEGTFAGVIDRLDDLADLGVTAIELMPLADFPGRRGWGYDGVLPFAPDAAYGSPDDLKRLVEAAHARGFMVFVDVVYNHFGPAGNYLGLYAPPFFTDRHSTPWGAAIDYAQRPVRDFAIHNALYWIEEYGVDGLRLDAVHAIHDDTNPHVLDELARRVQAGPGRERLVHLVLENDDNTARYLADGYRAQWNDDIHHAFHVIATGEDDGYYADYASAPLERLGRCLAEGFAFQGDPSPYRDGAPRGTPSAHLPPTAFVAFMQNHDQIGNRAFGERLDALAPPDALEALMAILLLAPHVPLLFMGEEFGASTPFLYFCDHEGDLAQAVTRGRRNEFKRFARFSSPEAVARIPDPNAEDTFVASRIDWSSLTEPTHAGRRARVRMLLTLRAREIVPRLVGIGTGHTYRTFAPSGFEVRWRLGSGETLILDANLGPVAQARAAVPGRVLFRNAHDDDDAHRGAWAVRFSLADAR